MPGRSYTSQSFRYGFNGMEKDDEISGSGNHYTTYWRPYNPRLGKWLSLDPKPRSNISLYAACSNNPILKIDPRGDDDYFDQDGNYLYTDTKTSNDIRIISTEAWASILNAYALTLFNTEVSNLSLIQELESKSAPLRTHTEIVSDPYLGKYRSRDNDVNRRIANYYYQKAGFVISELNDRTVKETQFADELGSGYYPAYGTDGKFDIRIAFGEYGGVLINTNDIMSVFIHERGGHAEEMANGKKYPGRGSSEATAWERRAMFGQVIHDSWDGTSLEFKQTMYDRYGKYTSIFSEEEQQKYFGEYGIKLNTVKGDPFEH